MTNPPLRVATLLIVAVLASGCSDTDGEVQSTEVAEQKGDDGFLVPGVVIDDDLLPVPDATILVRETTFNATTDGLGRFRLGPMPAGSIGIIVQKAGYQEAFVEIDVPVDAEVRITLLVVPSAEPYYETRVFEGYYDCMIAAAYPTGNPTWPCLGIIDLAAGTQLARDKWLFPFTIEAPGFLGLLVELTWQVQPTASWMSVQIRDAEGLDETGANSYFYNRSLPNLHAWAYAGQENPGGDAPFYPEPGAVAKYQFTTSSATSGADVDFQFWLSHRSTLYATFFYHELVAPEFSVLPDS